MIFHLCFVVVTCRTLCWTFLSLLSCLAVTASVISPQWLLGSSPEVPDEGRPTDILYVRRQSLGIFNRCGMYPSGQMSSCATYIKPIHLKQFPFVWKVSLAAVAMAIGILFSAVGGAIASLCVRYVFKRSIFMIMGVAQGVAGILLLIALMLFPLGWSALEVREICGRKAGPFLLHSCTLGWSFYAYICGTALVFVVACLATQAQASAASRKVQEELQQGNNLICVI